MSCHFRPFLAFAEKTPLIVQTRLRGLIILFIEIVKLLEYLWKDFLLHPETKLVEQSKQVKKEKSTSYLNSGQNKGLGSKLAVKNICLKWYRTFFDKSKIQTFYNPAASTKWFEIQLMSLQIIRMSKEEVWGLSWVSCQLVEFPNFLPLFPPRPPLVQPPPSCQQSVWLLYFCTFVLVY